MQKSHILSLKYKNSKLLLKLFKNVFSCLIIFSWLFTCLKTEIHMLLCANSRTFWRFPLGLRGTRYKGVYEASFLDLVVNGTRPKGQCLSRSGSVNVKPVQKRWKQRENDTGVLGLWVGFCILENYCCFCISILLYFLCSIKMRLRLFTTSRIKRARAT